MRRGISTLMVLALGLLSAIAVAEDKKGAQPIAGRVCAIKKSKAAAERARARAERDSRRGGHQVQPETLEAAEYIFVFTTLDEHVPATAILEIYRGRWQVELAFKRLKSILATGHLKKTDPIGAKAWLQGKLLAAVIIEALISLGERFSPWGYRLPEFPSALPVARDLADEIPA